MQRPDAPWTWRAICKLSLTREAFEVGAIMYSPHLQGTTAGTEAMYLMMKRAFDELGYRRYEWRCHALNEASRNGARRLGTGTV
jgi:RimJ/RimL family protein N-acetyltransferase